LDNIIDMIFFYPDYVREARLSFNQKLQIARAYCLRKNNNSMWALLAGINAIRNEISHNLAGEKRQKKIDQLRTMFLAELQPAEAKRYERAADHIIAASACGMCIGFLGTYEHDLKGLRKFVDLLDIAINSDKEHVALKE
ncbi:MAG: hypothetical protein ABSE69_13045, partial [Roseiarcus sp.]